MDAKLEALSTQEMQAYGAACLARFCSVKEIDAQPVLELVDHLVQVLTADDLGAWEAAGTGLALPGRGDPLPTELRAALAPDLAHELETLVDRVVEIGMADMYGADTDLPLRFLHRSLELLEAAGVAAPPFGELFPSPKPDRGRGWSDPVPIEEQTRIRDWCFGALSPRAGAR